jgi:CheY-like chemotaxis protein/two-component sensor histidine kinase
MVKRISNTVIDSDVVFLANFETFRRPSQQTIHYWWGDKDGIEAYKEWAEKAYKFLTKHPNLLTFRHTDEGWYGLLRTFCSVAQSTPELSLYLRSTVIGEQDLLDVSRISRGKIELRRARIELASTVHHAVEAARPLAQCMELDLSVNLPPEPIYLNGDPVRLAQVVGNLLNNACKFTDKGGQIWLTGEREGDQVVIRVRDSGVGIAAEQLPHIFEMFMQIDTSLERSVSGLGIGLALVKNLVQLHGGTVEVHSAGVGKGTDFEVRLPLVVETPESSPPAQAVDEGAPTAARRILVVDDNRDSADSLVQLLKLTGNETQTAYDGLEAVAAAETFRPDAMLLDVGLPKFNGHEACRRIREQPWGKNIIIVALAGWGQDEDRQKSKETGFSGHMVKPVELKALHALLTQLSAAL